MEKKYALTKYSCYLGYFTQAIGNNFLPLLFVFFNSHFGLSVAAISFLALFNFIVQLVIDAITTFVVEKIGYKPLAILSSSSSAIGLGLLALLPNVMNPFWGCFIAIIFISTGGGLGEMIISPIIEKVSDNNSASMGILHGMYCFGAALAILIAFIYFLFADISSWWNLSLIFMSVPLFYLVLSIFSIYPSMDSYIDNNKIVSTPFYKKSSFYLLCLMIAMGGATELGIAQWISSYAEVGLNVNKPFGDLYGAFLFALVQGIFRVVYAFMSKKIKVELLMILGASVSTIGYLLASLPNNGVINFIGAILVGVGVASLWPATLTLASRILGDDNPKIFTILALTGDVGCGIGTYLIGALVSPLSFRYSILIGTSFPIIFIISILLIFLTDKYYKKKKLSE